MSDFIFFIKLFCLTVAIVLVMQIQVGQQSLESHALGWVQTSALVAPINTAAHGGARFIRDMTDKVHGAIMHSGAGKKKKEEKKSSSSFRWTHLRGEPAAEQSPSNY